ncbi:MAG: STAS domain-containing protein [Mycolicibacterium sp.]|nr:STAS domain-containing protein [Mycolicibacterium sp.]
MNCQEEEKITSGLGLTETWSGDVAVVGVSGELDMLTAPELAGAIEAAARKNPAALVVDLSAVDFLASAGMSTLITAHEDIAPRARFALVADGPATSRPLRLVGIDQIFAVYRTLDDALAGVGSERHGRTDT